MKNTVNEPFAWWGWRDDMPGKILCTPIHPKEQVLHGYFDYQVQAPNPLYTQADLERQHKRFIAVGLLCDDTLDKYSELQAQAETLRTQLAEAHTLLREVEHAISATAPVEINERVEFEIVARPICQSVTGRWIPALGVDGRYRNQTSQMLWEVWQARATLVLNK